jgi:hypothetical protein
VRWYLRFKVSFRDLVEMMAERGIDSAHTTIMRWIQRYIPEFEKRWNRRRLMEWMPPPDGIAMCQSGDAKVVMFPIPRTERASMEKVSIIGLDLAKREALKRSVAESSVVTGPQKQRAAEVTRSAKAKSKGKAPKRIEGQKEMLLPIPGKKATASKEEKKPAAGRGRKAS